MFLGTNVFERDSNSSSRVASNLDVEVSASCFLLLIERDSLLFLARWF